MIKSTPLTHITVKLNDTVIQVETFKFSAGEIQVKLDVDALNVVKATVMAFSVPPTLYILAHIRSSDDLITIQLISSAFVNWARETRTALSDARVVLEIPYLPYSRQDRVCAPGEANSLSVLSDLYSLFDRVISWDIHNPKATGIAMIENIPSVEFITTTLATKYKGGVNIVCPDKGARERAEAIRQIAVNVSDKSGIVYLDKTRDPTTGTITGIGLSEMHIFDPSLPFLIVDDICDGGRTFISAASVLNAMFTQGKKAPVIDLYVTHGIFSAGFDALGKAFRSIYIANNVNGITLPRQVSVVTR